MSDLALPEDERFEDFPSDDALVTYSVYEGELSAPGQVADQYAAANVFDDYLARKSAHTRSRHHADLRLFAEYFREIKPDTSIDADALQRDATAWRGMSWGLLEGFKRWMLKRGYSISSINARISAVKIYTGLAFQSGVIDEKQHQLLRVVKGYGQKEAKRVNETRAVSRVGRKKAEAVSISKDQAKQLKDQPNTPQGRRDRLMMCLLLDHGLRVGEVVLLQVDNFNFGDGTMRFYRPKVDKEQTHKLTGDTKRALKAYFTQGDALVMGPLLRASHKTGSLAGSGMTTRAITARVRQLGEVVGLHGLSAHDCRHYWATHAARAGTDSFVLQEAGGWSSLAMPRRYVEDAKIANSGVKGFED